MPGLSQIISYMGPIQRTLDVISGDIAGAADPNHSSRRVALTTVTSGDGGIATGLRASPPQAYVNYELAREIRVEQANAGYNTTIGELLGQFDRMLGQPGTINSVTNQITRLQSALARFSARPENLAARNEVVTTASSLATTFNRIEAELQRLRQSTENDIVTSVKQLQDQFKIVVDANQKISTASNTGQSASSDEDRRRAALNEIATLMNFQVNIDADSTATIIGPRNIGMLRSPSTPISFAPGGNISAATSYPGSLNGLMIDGQDVTSQLGEGKLKALFELRDKTFPSLSAQFAQLAAGLKDEMNVLHNKASTYPGAVEFTSSKIVAGADTLFGAGQFRVAVLDEDGIVTNVGNINMAGLATVYDVVTALNTAMGAGGTASIDAQGHLKIVATNGRYVAINEDTSQVLDSSIKVERFNNAGTSLGSNTYNTATLGSLAAIVTQMNIDFAGSARADLDGTKINITALSTNQLSVNDYPKTFGHMIRSRGASDYFGLNNFFDAETSVISPQVSTNLRLNSAIQRNSSLLGHGSLSLTAAVGQVGLTNQGLPDASGFLPVQLFPGAFDQKIKFFSTTEFSAKTISFREYANATMGYVGAKTQTAKMNQEMAETQRDNFVQSYEKFSRKSLRELLLSLTEFVTAMQSLHAIAGKTQELEKSVLSIGR